MRVAARGADSKSIAAAGAAVVVCIFTRIPDSFLRAMGIRAWALGLVGVIAVVNGARVLAQAPFTFVRREGPARQWALRQLAVLSGAVLVAITLTVPLYGLLRASWLWWLWAWAMFAVVTVAAQAAMPVLIRIHAGKLCPADQELLARVRDVGHRAGVEVAERVFVADKISREPRCNAYVVGVGRAPRVVLESGVAGWPPELLDQVLAHEMGHWRLGHTARRLPLTLAVQLATFALTGALLSWSPLLHLAGVSGAGDPRSYPLLLALTPIVILPARLVLARYDRAQERAADRFALSLLAAPSAFVAMLDRSADEGGAARRLNWWQSAVASHPPVDQRISDCQLLAAAA